MSRKNVAQLITLAKKKGWVYLGVNGANHHRMQWPDSGEIVTLSCTPGHAQTTKAQHDLERVSGPLDAKPGPGRSKKQRAADQRRKQQAAASSTPTAARKPAAGPPVVVRPPEWKEKLEQWTATHPLADYEPVHTPLVYAEVAAQFAAQRDGGRFAAFCPCPHCGFTELHWLRIAEPGSGFEVIRECRACAFEFGQT